MRSKSLAHAWFEQGNGGTVSNGVVAGMGKVISVDGTGEVRLRSSLTGRRKSKCFSAGGGSWSWQWQGTRQCELHQETTRSRWEKSARGSRQIVALSQCAMGMGQVQRGGKRGTEPGVGWRPPKMKLNWGLGRGTTH